jgi:hypothetical protein
MAGRELKPACPRINTHGAPARKKENGRYLRSARIYCVPAHQDRV